MAKGATTNKLDVEVRTRTGKGASRQARREGKVPAVLYGHGAEPQHINLNAHDFAAVLRHSGANAVLSLQIDGKEQLALSKAITIHPVRRNLQHIDLIVVKRGEKVTVEVQVHLEGEADSGTLVTQDATAIEIEAEALSIPEGLSVSIEGAPEGTQILASRWSATRRCWLSTSSQHRPPRTWSPRAAGSPSRTRQPKPRPRRHPKASRPRPSKPPWQSHECHPWPSRLSLSAWATPDRSTR
jgi:large subunit ribosomal protein L25